MIPTETTEDEKARNAHFALLPVGAFEQHGPFLPLATDTFIACAIARVIAAKYSNRLLPPITISCSHEHADWPGTISISHNTLSSIISDVQRSLGQSMIRHLILVNAHGGNYVLSNIVQEANDHRPGSMALFPSPSYWTKARQDAGIETNNHDDMHAGELETSILLHARPEVVREGWQTADHRSERPHLLIRGMRSYSPTGVIGSPSLASAEKGAAVLESLGQSFSEVLTVLAAAAQDK